MSDGQIYITAQTDLSQAQTNIDNFSKRAQITLTNLNQVVQDLPFGFIGIQNNLPGLIQSFSTLAKEEKGVTGALNAIGTALIGPVGLTFAFSAVISGITSLVQSYGSLGAALTDIFGLQLNLKDLQNKYNDSLKDTVGKVAAESVTLKNLGDILTNTNDSLDKRNNAYKEINKDYPGLLANIDKEKLLNGQLNETLAIRIALFTKQIELNGKQEALQKLIAKSAEEQFAVTGKLATGGYFDALGLQLKGLLQGDFSVTSAATAIGNTFSKTGKETVFYSKTLKTVQDELIGVNSEVDKLIKLQREANKPIKELKQPKVKVEKPLDIEELAIKARYKATELQTKADRNSEQATKDKTKAEEDFFDALVKSSFEQEKFGNITDKISKINIDAALQPFKDITEGASKAKILLEDLFFNPLEEMFTTLFTKGTFSIKDFTKSLLTSIGQIAAKLASTAVVSGLISLFAAPFGGALSGGGLLSGLGNLIGSNIGQNNNPNFNGVRNGGMDMTGNVNLVLRGTDLVGSINRTNMQINRIG